MTGRALVALVESHLSAMTPKEQGQFWVLATHHRQNRPGRELLKTLGNTITTVSGALREMASELTAEVGDLSAKLQKHRRPKANADRDAEIVRLAGEGKKPLAIARALKTQYPGIDPGKVRAVLSRHRSKPSDDEWAHGS